MSKKKWKEPANCKWRLIEYDSAFCAECGKDYWTGFSTTKEAQSKWDAEHLYAYCPHCGAKMFVNPENEVESNKEAKQEETKKPEQPAIFRGGIEFPHDEKELDVWMAAVQGFNDRFVEMVKGVLCLWGVRHLMSEKALDYLCSTIKEYLEQICKVCPADSCSKGGLTCKVKQCIKTLSKPREA